jgi:type III secretory pathway component EscS
VSTLEERLRDSLTASAAQLDESDDLFARVELGIADDRRLRRQRRRRAVIVAALAGAVFSVVAATTEIREGALIMDWWVLEIIWFAGMLFLALWLGPFIRRFGKSYAADVFRSNPRTGKSFIVLMDVAYYLIFLAYILFTVQFEPAGDWEQTVSAAQLRATAVRVGGILLIIGVLHGLNVLALPVIGRILTLNRRLDEDTQARGVL